MNLTPTDINILDLLQRDASLTAAEIAEQVNLSASPCWRRINRLEKEGFIDRKVALLNIEKLGMGLLYLHAFDCQKTTRLHCRASRNRCAVTPKWWSVTR